MLANLVGHWVLGLPIGAALCFWIGWGVVGLWIGLCTGLVSVAVVLIAVWRRRTAELVQDFASRRHPPTGSDLIRQDVNAETQSRGDLREIRRSDRDGSPLDGTFRLCSLDLLSATSGSAPLR